MAIERANPDGEETAGQVWARLSARRQNLMTRCERYAALTIPKTCLPDGVTPDNTEQGHDYQSLGAQAVNHVVNKLMVAMFAPSRPFFRVKGGQKTKQQAAEMQLTETQLDDILAKMERDGSGMLDTLAQRPKLYQLARHLVITGNALMILDKKVIRCMGLKSYVVKRTFDQEVHTLCIQEKMRFDELERSVQDILRLRHQPDDLVSLYRLIKKTETGYRMSQWVDEVKLPPQFSARWTKEKFPYRVLAWDLADESDYGTGLVEDYSGDFEALSSLSEAVVTGGVIGTEFRWVAHPNGVTSIEDFRSSVNGDVIPGAAKDIGVVSPGVQEAVKIAQAIAAEYGQRISRGFLLTSAVTRDAERVTAEEVRMTQMELESSFGGTYSALAPSLQRPIANWMLAEAGTALGGSDLDIVVVTGLDALSRNGDLDNLRMALSDLASFATAPEGILARIKWDELAKFIGQGRGVDLTRFVMGQQEFAQAQQAAMAQQQQQEVNTAGGVARAEADAQPPQE